LAIGKTFGKRYILNFAEFTGGPSVWPASPSRPTALGYTISQSIGGTGVSPVQAQA